MASVVSVAQDVVEQPEETLDVQRLGEKLSRARGLGPVDVAGRGVRAYDDHGNVTGGRIALEPLQHLGPGDVGELEVQEDQARLVLAGQLEPEARVHGREELDVR